MEFYFPKTPGLGFEFSPGIPQVPDRLAFLELTTAEVENSMHTISSAIRSSSMPKS